MVTILQSLTLPIPLVRAVMGGVGEWGSYDGVTLAVVHFDRLFILAFAPIFGVIVGILGWRVWTHWKNSQQ